MFFCLVHRGVYLLTSNSIQETQFRNWARGLCVKAPPQQTHESTNEGYERRPPHFCRVHCWSTPLRCRVMSSCSTPSGMLCRSSACLCGSRATLLIPPSQIPLAAHRHTNCWNGVGGNGGGGGGSARALLLPPWPALRFPPGGPSICVMPSAHDVIRPMPRPRVRSEQGGAAPVRQKRRIAHHPTAR
jgi:hypothetical protein